MRYTYYLYDLSTICKYAYTQSTRHWEFPQNSAIGTLTNIVNTYLIIHQDTRANLAITQYTISSFFARFFFFFILLLIDQCQY